MVKCYVCNIFHAEYILICPPIDSKKLFMTENVVIVSNEIDSLIKQIILMRVRLCFNCYHQKNVCRNLDLTI